MKAIDLFCGAGGGSLGLHRTGVDVIGGIDLDEDACQTYERNLDRPTLCEDITELSYQEIVSKLDAKPEDIDIVMGCPPCQNFSNLRDTKPWPEDTPKDELLVTFVERIREGKPKVVLFENVTGILNTDDGQYVDYFLNEMKEMGYGVKLRTVDASEYGVPQSRERVIAFGILGKDKEDINFPEPTHKNSKVTVKDAIADLPELSAGESSEEIHNHEARNHQKKTLERFRSIPEDGGGRKDMPKELWLECHKNMENQGAESVYSRMWWDRPAPTITTQCTAPSSGRFIHPEQDRGITVREAARLQTFPDNYVFPKTKKAASRLVGNAVPPDLIETLVSQFLEKNDL